MLVSLLASFFAVSTVNAQVNERGDSVIVIKGQVSDYYITVSPEHFLEGTVTGPDGKPLAVSYTHLTLPTRVAV